MKKMVRFNNMLTLTNPSKKGLGFLLINAFAYTFIYNQFFTPRGVYQLDFVILFGLAVLVVSYYAYIAHTSADNPVYQLPWTAKERVLYSYLNAIFVFFGMVVVVILFGYLMLGLFVLLGDGLDSGNDVSVSLRASLYLMGNSILLFAIYMPTSFYKNTKKRYLHALLAFVFLVLMNLLVTLILSGSISLSTSLLVHVEQASNGLGLSLGIVIFSLLALFISYYASIRLTRYK